MSLIDDLEIITRSQSVEATWATLSRRLRQMGFSRLLYGLTRFKTERSFGDPQDLMILSNHDPAYLDRFIGDRMYLNAPMVRWSETNTGACSWGWLEGRLDALSPREKQVLQFNRDMGVTAGYTISFPHGSARARGAMALVGAPGQSQSQMDAVWQSAGREADILCQVAHLKFLSLPHRGTRRALTSRQREVLEWVGDGKTTQDIAIILDRTAATIEKHLRQARQALEVETTAQAVLKASMQNQIFLIGEAELTQAPGDAAVPAERVRA